MEAADRACFHVDEWVFSSVLLPSYEKGDPVRRRLYEAIKNVCHFGLSNVTGKGKKKKPVQKWQGNKAVFNARNSFLSTVRRSLETGAAESAREALLGRLEKKKLGALFGFARLYRNAHREDNETFPNADPVALCQNWGRCGVFLKASIALEVVMTFKYAEEPERESLQSKCILKGVFSSNIL